MSKRGADEYITKDHGSIANNAAQDTKVKMATAAQLAKRKYVNSDPLQDFLYMAHEHAFEAEILRNLKHAIPQFSVNNGSSADTNFLGWPRQRVV